MTRIVKALVGALTLVLLLALAPGQVTPAAEACSPIPFYCCVDQCDDAWDACMAACPPNTPMCELGCNNAWWDCNWACAGS